MGITIIARPDDETIRTKVRRQLRGAPLVEADDLEVEVVRGTVTLAGTLRTYAQTCRAEQVVQQVVGVREVVCDIRVQLRDHQERPDAAIARAARRVLDWHSELSAETVEVTVEDGRVTLTGRIERPEQKDCAEQAVRCLTGVRGVQNECAVAGTPTPEEICMRVRALLDRHLGGAARHVHVRMTGDEVIVQGLIPSRTHREILERAVDALPGGPEVRTELTVDADLYVE